MDLAHTALNAVHLYYTVFVSLDQAFRISPHRDLHLDLRILNVAAFNQTA